MAALTLRSVKGSELTAAEIDANFTNLNTDKSEKASPTFTGTVTLPNSLVNVTTSSYPTVQPTLNLDFANTKQLDPRITFVRNSTAAYYDGQTSALAEQNLLKYSISVGGTGWAVVSITTTINAGIAPDNTTTASLLTASAGSGVPRTVNNVTGADNIVYTCSIYAKAGTFNILQIYDGSGSDNRFANFDLTSGTLGTYGNCVSSITSIGSGWYRCIVTYTPLSTNIANVFVMAATSSSGRAAGLTAIGTESWYLWGAQLEQRSSVTAYKPTTTAAITNYIPQLMTAPAGVARFDCDPITRNSLGLLIEESRTNLLTYSSEASSWPQGGVNTIVSNCIIAPDGTLTGDSLYTLASNIYKLISVTSGTVYTRSVYAKKGTSSIIGWEAAGAGAGSALFNFDTLAVTNSGVYSGMSAVSVGNGWYRISAQITPTLTANMTIYQYGGADYGAAGESYIWGAQLEAGSFATSYMPTVASTVTRARDFAYLIGSNFSSWYNNSQGSFLVDCDAATIAYTVPIFPCYGMNDDTYVGYTYIASGSIKTTAAKGGVNTTLISGTASINSPFKTVSAYTTNTISLCSTNGTVQTVTIPSAIVNDRIVLGGLWGTYFTYNGHIRKLSYYPVALSSTNLVALTS